MSDVLKRSFWSFAIGIILGLVITVTNTHLSSVEKQVDLALGLLVLVFTAACELWFRLADLDEKFSNLGEKVDTALIVAAREKHIAENVSANQRKDSFFQQRYKELREEIDELSSGKYHIRSLDELYHDDIRSIEELRPGEQLLSLCPVSSELEEIQEQFSAPSYIASLRAHQTAFARGVKVTRVYRFKDEQLFGMPEIRGHLSELAASKIDARVVFEDRTPGKVENFDFLVFGDKKVSIGKLGTDRKISGAEVDIDPDRVKNYQKKYKEIVAVSIPIRDKLSNLMGKSS
jgi:uncharacterized protein YceH (UPF0502 family)